MSKKLETGIRSEIVKGYSAEQIHSLIQMKEAMAKMSPEEAYSRLMYLLMEYYIYMAEFGFSDTSQWLDFVEELGRLREQLNDGFFAYSMYERIGGSEAKRLLELLHGRKVLFGIIAYYMVDYIVNNEDNRKKYTINVMNRLAKLTEIWDNSKEHNTNTVYVPVDSEFSYGMRNFYGKAKAIYKYDEFVQFLIDEFDIKDGKESNHEFVQAWASLYMFLWNIYKTHPIMLADDFLPKKEFTKLVAKPRASKNTIICSQEATVKEEIPNKETKGNAVQFESTPEKESVKVESTPEKESVKVESTSEKKFVQSESIPNFQEATPDIAPDVQIEVLLKDLRTILSKKEEALLEVARLEEKSVTAQGEVERLERKIKELTKSLSDAKLTASSAEAELKRARENALEVSRRYDEERQKFDKEYKRIFDD